MRFLRPSCKGNRTFVSSSPIDVLRDDICPRLEGAEGAEGALLISVFFTRSGAVCRQLAPRNVILTFASDYHEA